MRAVVYGRVSTDLQSETSVNEQVRRCQQYASLKGWDLVAEYTDVGSGMNTERSGFKQMMESIGEWDVVIAYKLDRFHRSSTNAQLWAKQLDASGKNFVALDYDIDTTSVHGRLIYTILTALAEMEVELTRERTRMGLQGVKNEGRHVGKPPYGYRSVYATTGEDSDKGILVPDPAEAEVVRLIFEMHEKSSTLTEVAEALIASGILTRSGKARWNTATIGDIIKRRQFYEGLYYNTENELNKYAWESIFDA